MEEKLTTDFLKKSVQGFLERIHEQISEKIHAWLSTQSCENFFEGISKENSSKFLINL